MATATKSKTTRSTGTRTGGNVRELRREAKNLGIDGWEDLNISQLKSAIKDAGGNTSPARKVATSAKKTTAKKAAAKKKAPAKAKAEDVELPENGNPFKPGTNMFEIAEQVIKGGKRAVMVKRLKSKIELAPRTDGEFDLDAELDRRVLIVGQILRNDHGFEVVREGRGAADGTIVATKS